MDFRNLVRAEIRPASGGLTVVTGDNGAGKTSLLEAIAYSCSQKSFRGSPRESLLRSGTEAAYIRVESVTAGHRSLVEIELAQARRDRILRNKQRVAKTQELLETLRCTVFSPDDLVLVKGGPQQRRDFLDDVVESSHPKLVAVRQSVERVLRQRNALLRQAGGRSSPDVVATLDVWDHQLSVAGEELVRAREQAVVELAPLADTAFRRLTAVGEGLQLDYERSFAGSLAAALDEARREDLRRGVTTTGPHRDELAIAVGGLDARTKLSQGRQRCATLALRLAAHAAVASHAGSHPVLLLDDAFSELDEVTAGRLMDELPPGQAILTTAGHLPPGARPDAALRVESGRIVT